MFAGCLVMSWSRTQQSYAMSSAESEYYAKCTGVVETRFIESMLFECGVHVRIRVKTDSSASKGFCEKPGLGKCMKHIELRYLFLQQLVTEKKLHVDKVGTRDQKADPMTKYLAWELLYRLMVSIGVLIKVGPKQHERRVNVITEGGQYTSKLGTVMCMTCLRCGSAQQCMNSPEASVSQSLVLILACGFMLGLMCVLGLQWAWRKWTAMHAVLAVAEPEQEPVAAVAEVPPPPPVPEVRVLRVQRAPEPPEIRIVNQIHFPEEITVAQFGAVYHIDRACNGLRLANQDRVTHRRPCLMLSLVHI